MIINTKDYDINFWTKQENSTQSPQMGHIIKCQYCKTAPATGWVSYIIQAGDIDFCDDCTHHLPADIQLLIAAHTHKQE